MVYLVQLLCPARHAIAAAAYEESARTFEQVCQEIREELASLHVNPWCGICGSRDLRFEEARTPYQTMAEAARPLLEAQIQNMFTRSALDAAGLTHDKRRNN